MKLYIDHIFPDYPNKIRVQWDIEDPDSTLLNGVTFSVYRSGSPDGPWKLKSSSLTGVFYTDIFVDGPDDETEENLLSLSKQIWYRVEAYLSNGDTLESQPMDNFGTLPTLFNNVQGVGIVPGAQTNYPGPSTIFHPTKGLDNRLQMIQRAHQRRALINLQYFSGVHVAVLKRKSFGKRCTQCFDQATKTVTTSNCSNCYGTGWVGGYYTPMASKARVQEAPVQTQIEPSAKIEIIQSNIELMDFPRVKKDDLIIEADTNRRWIVGTINDRSLRRRRLTQQVNCKELSRTASQYSVPVDFNELVE